MILFHPGFDRRHIGQPQLQNDLADEVDPFAQTVQQNELLVRVDDGQRQSRQAGTGPHIDEALPVQVGAYHQTVEDMLDQHGVRITNRGEIVSLVPLVQQLDQLHQLALLGIGDNNSGLHEQAVQSFQHIFQR